MADVIVIGMVVLMVTGALTYIKKEKKRGVRCIGCPNREHCLKNKCGVE